MWAWLQGLSGGAATFVGSLTGSAIGLIALLIGALFNAHLNRQRDDDLRRHDTRGLAAALHAELSGSWRSLTENAEDLRTKQPHDFVVPDLAQGIRVLPAMLPRLGLLDADTIRAVIDAHLVIEQYVGHLTMQGGIISEQSPTRRLIALKKETIDRIILINGGTADTIQLALNSLAKYLS
jgi:hypothetical protein